MGLFDRHAGNGRKTRLIGIHNCFGLTFEPSCRSFRAAHPKEQLEHVTEVMTGIGRQAGVIAHQAAQ